MARSFTNRVDTLKSRHAECAPARLVAVVAVAFGVALPPITQDRVPQGKAAATLSGLVVKATAGTAHGSLLPARDPNDLSSAPSAPDAPLLKDVDPLTGLPYEWQFSIAHVEAAFDISTGSASVVVGTIDSGTAEIPDLVGKVDSRWSVSAAGRVRRDSRGDDYLGHGTAVASLVAANGFGMAGFGGETHVISIRVPKFTDLAVAAALMKLDALGARIVNMSFGQELPEGQVVLKEIEKAEADGMLLIAAAGNANGPVSHPAADLQPPNGRESAGLAVGASDRAGNLAFFSNSGVNLSLLAPGNDDGPCSGVLVAAPINEDFVNACYPSWYGAAGAAYAYVSGTSFAAPEVAGIAALIWAVRPTLTNYQVADILKQSAHRTQPGWTPRIGCGTLDAGAALALATSRTDTEWATNDPVSPCASAVDEPGAPTGRGMGRTLQAISPLARSGLASTVTSSMKEERRHRRNRPWLRERPVARTANL